MLFQKLKRYTLLLLCLALTAGIFSACGKKEPVETIVETKFAKEGQTEPATVAVNEDGIPTVTSMGITVPQDLKESWISLYDCIYFAGPCVSQDGSWEWIDAQDTTPKRGDLVVYVSAEDLSIASHESVCIQEYDGEVYMNIDGNYGEEPGGLWKGRYDTGVPNKHWPDSYPNNPGTETALGVYRAKNPADSELMALAAEAVYDEYKIVGQDLFLKKYMPDFYHGVWCYYLIPIAVNAAARHKVELPEDFEANHATVSEPSENGEKMAVSATTAADQESTETETETDTATSNNEEN